MLTKRQEAELVTAIQGRGETPMKFTYIGQEGASNWDKIATQRSNNGGINSYEFDLLSKRVETFVSALSSDAHINVVDIGCGNGQPVFPILKYLKEKGRSFTYVPLDISKEMLDLAVGNVEKEFPKTESKSFQLDFELGQFSEIMYELKKNNSVNLMLHLGSTLGNHSDLHRVLTNFRDSMTSKDFLIIGVELTNLAKAHNIVHHYESETILDLVSLTLDRIGVSRDDYKHEILWNENKSQIEIRASLSKDVEINLADESFTLGKGESILLVKSIKFTEPIVTNLFSNVGFRTELLTTNENRGYLLSMVQPTRYSV